MYSGGGDSNDDLGVEDVGGVSTNGGDHTFCIFGVLKLVKLWTKQIKKLVSVRTVRIQKP